jgi:hypothetical protein
VRICSKLKNEKEKMKIKNKTEKGKTDKNQFRETKPAKPTGIF